MSEGVSTDEMVAAYIALRDERAKLREQYEADDAKLLADMDKIEVALLSLCNNVNATSIKTSNGTIIRRLMERFYCTDWDNFNKFVMDNEAIHLLERRIHQGNFKEFMSAHEGDGLPPGVNVTREYGITIRKSSAQ